MLIDSNRVQPGRAVSECLMKGPGKCTQTSSDMSRNDDLGNAFKTVRLVISRIIIIKYV